MGTMVKAALLLIYYGAMRQSEVVPQSQRAFNPTRHLTRRDVAVARTLAIRVKWAKNMQRYNQQRTLTMLPTGDPNTCPVQAVAAVLRAHRNCQCQRPSWFSLARLAHLPRVTSGPHGGLCWPAWAWHLEHSAYTAFPRWSRLLHIAPAAGT